MIVCYKILSLWIKNESVSAHDWSVFFFIQ
nr:MAG TPA: hypothetical protein [Caudoviricetes sp.]